MEHLISTRPIDGIPMKTCTSLTRVLGVAAVAGLALSACGSQGSLESFCDVATGDYATTKNSFGDNPNENFRNLAEVLDELANVAPDDIRDTTEDYRDVAEEMEEFDLMGEPEPGQVEEYQANMEKGENKNDDLAEYIGMNCAITP